MADPSKFRSRTFDALTRLAFENFSRVWLRSI